MPYRNNLLPDGTPVQQSMTVDREQYIVENINIPLLGVILDVRPSDDRNNRSAQEWEDFRGYVPECSVLIVRDNMFLDRVLITPDMPAGIDDYYERLPRGSSKLVTGEELPSSFGNIDPMLLDGDWCIVGFFKGKIDSPYVMRWFPNPNNRFDPATSGKAFPNLATGEGAALEQAGRYFSRVNGVEFVITTEGDVSLSTRFSNSQMDFQKNAAASKGGTFTASSSSDNFSGGTTEGRFPRTEREDGGSVRVQMKPTQTFEVDFEPQIDGIGWDDVTNSELPQTNPENPGNLPPDRTLVANTYARFDSSTIILDVPAEFEVTSKDLVNINVENTTTITSPEIYLVSETEVIIGTNTSDQFLALGTKLTGHLATPGIIASPMGPLSINPPSEASLPSSPAWASVLSDKHKVEDRSGP